MKSIDFKSLLIGILGTALVMIGMGYDACRLFDMNNISKQIKSSKPDFLYTEREFWEFYPERDLN